MGETAARFPPWPGGGAPGNHSEGSPGDPLIPFPSRGKECLPGEGPRPQARTASLSEGGGSGVSRKPETEGA